MSIPVRFSPYIKSCVFALPDEPLFNYSTRMSVLFSYGLFGYEVQLIF